MTPQPCDTSSGSTQDPSAPAPLPESSDGSVPPRRSLRSNLAALATSQLITWVLTFLWTLIVPRLLGPEMIGLMVIATSLSAITMVVLGVATREFMVKEMVSDPGSGGRLVSTALLTRLGTLPFVLLVTYAYGEVAHLNAHDMVVMYVTALATWCGMLMDVALAVFQAGERMHYMALLDVGIKSLTTLGAVVLALAGLGVIAISSLALLVSALGLGVALTWMHRLVRMGARPAPILKVLRKARPYWVISVLFVGYVWVDALFLGLLAPAEVVGWYGAATRLFTTLGFVAVIVATATLPRLVAAHEEGGDRMYDAARQPFEWVVIAGLPLGVGMACIAHDLVPFLYGSEYAGSVIPLILLCLGLPLTYINTLANQMFIASGRPTMTAWLLTAAAAANLALNFLLIPWTQEHWGNGAIGAAGSLLLTELLQTFLCLAVLGRTLLTRDTVLRLGRASLATLGMTGCVLALDAVGLFWLVQPVVGVLVFFGLCLLLRVFRPSELELARAGLQRLRGRRTRAGDPDLDSDRDLDGDRDADREDGFGREAVAAHGHEGGQP